MSFFVRVFEGGGDDGKMGLLEGDGRGNEYWKGLAGEMDQNSPCHDPCQLSPCSVDSAHATVAASLGVSPVAFNLESSAGDQTRQSHGES